MYVSVRLPGAIGPLKLNNSKAACPFHPLACLSSTKTSGILPLALSTSGFLQCLADSLGYLHSHTLQLL